MSVYLSSNVLEVKENDLASGSTASSQPVRLRLKAILMRNVGIGHSIPFFLMSSPHPTIQATGKASFHGSTLSFLILPQYVTHLKVPSRHCAKTI